MIDLETNKRIFISAGDPSGDTHAARLMLAIKEINPKVSFIGIGGDAMIEAGLKSIVPLNQMSVVGFWEVAKRYGFFKKILFQCKEMLETQHIDGFIPVDYPGFNIPLAKFAKQIKIPVIYYIAPQLWAWGKNRAKKLASRVDKLLVVFPFEVEFFSKFGIDVQFIGHPLLDNPVFTTKPKDFNNRDKIIALMPGSRKQEIIKHLPLFERISELLIKAHPGFKFGIGQSSAVDISIYSKFLKKNPNWTLWDDSRKLMQSSLVGIVKTGTSTLEAALCGVPFSMIYKTSPITYLMGKRLVNLPYVSLVNILANKRVINEFIQSEANPAKIAEDINNLLNDKIRYYNIQSEYLNIRNLLGESGASRIAAETILKELNEK